MKRTALIASVLALLAAPSTAQAVPYLSYGEAARQIGKQLHKSARYGATRGSLVVDCYRVTRNHIFCYISFLDGYRDPWCGRARVRENRRGLQIVHSPLDASHLHGVDFAAVG